MSPRNFNLILFVVVISILCHFTYRSARTANIVGEAIELIEQNYVDPIDRRELVIAAMGGVVNQLDEHSSYFAVDQYESFQDSMNQEFAGIGIYVDQKEGTPVRVVTPLVDSPALRAGVLPDDLIIRVDGQDVSTMLLAEVSDRLKGPPGSTVAMVVLRGEEELSMSVRRATIELESVVGDHRDASDAWVYRLAAEPSVAYVRLKSFGEKTVGELRQVLSALDNEFDALVMDLRGNGGGLLYAARDVSDMFLPAGQIVSTRTRGGRIEESYSATPGTLVDPGKPVAILIDGNSASASEIVAASLQDNGRAIVVGTRSYGKGTVQEIMPLEYGRSALRLTVARYYRPNNQNIHRAIDADESDQWGVTPDQGFVVPMDETAIMNLGDRWREASFPLLASSRSAAEVKIVDRPSGGEPSRPLPSVELARDADRPGESSPRPSEEAERNIARGPVGLEDDPPLRAAVGRLLDLANPGPETVPMPADDPSDDENGSKSEKNAA